MSALLVKGGLAVTYGAETFCDILCEDGIITRIGKDIFPEAGQNVEVIDAAGKIVIPGGVDAHTHFNIDVGIAASCDDFYSGTVAAACGGTTTVIDHPGFGPAGCDLDHQITKYHGLAEGKAVIDYGFHGVIQHVDAKVLSMMEKLAGEGITSFKLYLTYGYKLNDGDVLKVLRRAKDLNLLTAVHAENDGVIALLRDEFRKAGKTSPACHPLSRPAECEAEAVSRMILFARMAGDAPLYIVHLSSALGLEFAKAAKKRGQKNLFLETCPQYMLLDESYYSLPGDEGLKFIMCPPLRPVADKEALLKALEKDIDVVATDHCSFTFEDQKMAGKDDFAKCPSGAPGAGERIPLMYNEAAAGRISLKRFTDLCCANPARLFGVYPQKGVIAIGSDADLVIIDPEKRAAIAKGLIRGNAGYSAYEGMNVKGWPVIVISRGEVIARDGEFSGKAGRGKFLKRKLYSPPF
ncbi:MAG: dihydropyrimidinase [Treponema sp.]|jgi:dihydropyrimidinase|nr:dihydropyrimidinase [Treponema sp.]